MHFKIVLSAVTFMIFCQQIAMGQQLCTETNFSFKGGEEVTYTAYYNWSFIWVDAGEVVFRTTETTYKNQDVFHLYSYGTSHKKYDWFYKVRDRFECFIDRKTLKPYHFERENYEGGYEVHNIYDFDQECNKIYAATKNSDKPLTLDTLEYTPCTFDVLSVIYQSRNIDYTKYKVDEKIPVTIVLDGKIYNLYLRYLGKETIELKSKRKFNCIKFSPLLVEGTMFNGGEDMVVWVTNDRNRIPVLVEAKILVGSVKAVLKDTKGIRNEIVAEVFD